jgi:hypothetical protein
MPAMMLAPIRTRCAWRLGRKTRAFPQSDGKHPAKLSEAFFSAFFIEVDDRFGVGVGREAMATGDQVVPKLRVIVDFPIEHPPYLAILVGNWLVTTFNIDDAEAPESKSDPRTQVDAFIIWAAMDHRLGHLVNEAVGNLPALLEFIDSANPAHSGFPLLLTVCHDSPNHASFP